MVPWSSFIVPEDGHSGSSLQSQAGTTPSQPGRASANGKGVLDVNSHCPFLLISEALIKNGRKCTHSLWEFNREEIYCFSPLQELFFFFPLPLAATCVFVTTLFCSSSTKRSGWVLNRKRSFLRIDHTGFLTFVLKVCFGVIIKGWLGLDKEALTARGLNFKAEFTRNRLLFFQLESQISKGHLLERKKVKPLCYVWLFVTLWTVAHQAPPSMGFSRQEYWSGLPFPSRRDLSNSGIEPRSPALQADALTSEPPGKPIFWR